MLFSSVEFLFRFLPVFMLLYLFIPEKYRNIVLLSGSLLFYAAGEPYYVLLLILSILINYGAGKLILDKEKKTAKNVLILSLIYNFGMLFIFKYWDFAAGILNRLSAGETIPVLSLSLPLGISFYTFQIVSYLFDCYRGKWKEKTDFVSFAAYVTMFPQLVAGPIVKYEEVAERMKARKIRAKSVESGLKLFSIGLGLKVLLANQIGTLWNTLMSAGPGNLSAAAAWMGAFAYSFQIYFDFWGYSLMAKGLGKMLGFRIPRNFNDPYTSRSVSEFWRRWHITLGRWFREYLYIPLGGNRKGFFRTMFNLFVVWSLTGLWLIALEKKGFGKWLESKKIAGHLYVILLIPVTWMVFAITDMRQLLHYLQNMIGIHLSDVIVGSEQVVRYLKEYGVLFIFCILFSTSCPMDLYRKYKQKWYVIAIIVVIFCLSVYEIMSGSDNPFL